LPGSRFLVGTRTSRFIFNAEKAEAQAAPTVNGPWENVDAPSPLTISADQAQQYGRAVTE